MKQKRFCYDGCEKDNTAKQILHVFWINTERNKLHKLCLTAFFKTCMISSFYKWVLYHSFKPFHANGLFWETLKTSENLWFSDNFRGYGKRPVV